MKAAAGIPVLAFASAKAWRQWLAKHHKTSDGIWLRLFKKASAKSSVTSSSVSYAEALDAALCYGWIDGQTKSHDAQSWLRKFTPRRARSLWSKKNLARVARLTKAGKMKAAGLKAVAAAKADGRLRLAYDAPSTVGGAEGFPGGAVPEREGQGVFRHAQSCQRLCHHVPLADGEKAGETREKRMKAILAMLGKGETFH